MATEKEQGRESRNNSQPRKRNYSGRTRSQGGEHRPSSRRHSSHHNNSNGGAAPQSAPRSGGKRENNRRTPVRIIPLGGLNEIGKNMTVFECSNDMFILDCGMAFPDADMPGVDIVLPDFTYVEGNKDKVRGIVITHGTDTMAYTSSALSYLIQNSPKPIIITGAQKPISMEVTDAKTNLLDSLRFAACPDAHGVCIVFNGKVIAGTRAKKVHSKSFNAFDSINFPALATIRNNQIVHYIKESCPCSYPAFYTDINPRVCLIKLIPGMDPELLTWVGEHYDAVIIESYGVGGLPSGEHRDFLSEVDKLIADGKIVVMTTQVMYEGSDMEVYEVGHVAKERYGLIESYDMTLEATVTKLMWIMAQTKDPQRIKAMFYTTINHDILFQ